MDMEVDVSCGGQNDTGRGLVRAENHLLSSLGTKERLDQRCRPRTHADFR